MPDSFAVPALLLTAAAVLMLWWRMRARARERLNHTNPGPRRRTLTLSLSDVEDWLATRYRDLEKVGHGGMGIVLRATDPERGETIAIKVLHADPTEEPDKLARFEREAEVLESLAHPGIVRFLSFEREPRPHFTMEHVEGEPFGDYLERQGPLPLEECLERTRTLLEALEAVHARDVVHRDLKPSNLLVTPSGTLKLLDFGVAFLRDAERLTADGDLLGTPIYMAPEQLRGQPATPASDLYSVGVMLYAMLTGENPFTKNVLLMKATEDPPAPSATRGEVTPELDAVVEKALARRPENRYPDARSFLDALERCSG